MIAPPLKKKRVAVVGGGPGGMKAALVAADRGHDVTLYEKSAALGGLLKTTDTVSFKWPVRDFKDYLVRQVAKSRIEVRLNTEATTEDLKKGNYDAVLIAVGSEPLLPPIPGVTGPNVIPVTEVYGKEDQLAEKVVIIGGGEVGMETGMHLAKEGHQVTLLEIQSKLAPDAQPIHYYSMFQAAWEALPHFKPLTDSCCTAISDTGVTYVDKAGEEHALEAGSVVIAAGMKARSDEVMKYLGVSVCLYVVGDCVQAGSIQKAMRSAFSTASTI
jgi:pyruvate/2-oxoglutarate dehydrogenase complex dihydrolipoamide dehydrogenase (E3) component